jgi:hypothetical protein
MPRKGFMSILDKLFGKPEEINGHGRCPTYLFRWILLKTKIGNIYLHHFVADDWSLDLHDHPKRFISIGLKGWYYEDTPSGTVKYTAPWIRTFPGEHIHRLRVPDKDTWTLVLVGAATREWGFWHQADESYVTGRDRVYFADDKKVRRFIPWKVYVKGKSSDIADKMKACD